MPLIDIIILSSEEASTQNTCDNLADISSINLRQIWVFPIPPVPQRRQEHLDINLLSVQWMKIFRSLLSTSSCPTNNELVLGFWSKRNFLLLVLVGRILLFWQMKYVLLTICTAHKRDLLQQNFHQRWVRSGHSPRDPRQDRESRNCQQNPRANSLSNSQSDFVLIPSILALRHRETRAVMYYGWPNPWAKWLVISNDNREHGMDTDCRWSF